MSPSAIAAASTATSTPACGSKLYEIPVTAAACAVSDTSSHTAAMQACCGAADVVSYYSDCGLYCLAQGQTVETLVACLSGRGVADQDVFCNAGTTASAASTAQTSVSAGVSASIVESGTAAASSATGFAVITTSSRAAVPVGATAETGLVLVALLQWLAWLI